MEQVTKSLDILRTPLETLSSSSPTMDVSTALKMAITSSYSHVFGVICEHWQARRGKQATTLNYSSY
jgi:hypothetical protein